ncbi:MAG TPA: acVLRF1 family peptidyl-tRNA hydrolase [Actinophytocola sp.]|uniref:acVLRF1 family peptidyl-tRNA hydrolase n=1 Tax=Actinophytocola sp. TaxID=1872138 RepID=UPI002DBAE983|nr:acVLRF1 family peptidyl-tRNA hydrolase [Actinophytocola sp.]HEU5470384.1 acVLRF1 family peptidyl-tRNA hydrolase [Actinophytocola sp.]
MKVRAVAGGGQAVEVEPERVTGWFARFAERHGGVADREVDPELVRVTATDGATATVAVPFAPLVPPDDPRLAVDVLALHLLRPRRIGLLLVRRGGHSVGIAYDGRIEVSRTDRRLVQGRSAAGGWSQRRFARRRAGQARDALRAAAQDAVEVLAPRVAELAAVVLGGEARALAGLHADPRLADVFALAASRVLDVGDPRRAVLDEAARRARCVEIIVREKHRSGSADSQDPGQD